VSKEIHETKIKISQRLIDLAISIFEVRKLLADAAYISINMIKFLNKLKIEFVTKIHSNRTVTKNGICQQMKKHPALKLNRNRRSKIVNVSMKGIEVNIVVFKRKKKMVMNMKEFFL